MRTPTFLALLLAVPVALLLAIMWSSRRPQPVAPAAPAPSLVAPPASPMRPAPAGAPLPPPGWRGPDMSKAARDMGMPIYPGAQSGGGGWGSSGVNGKSVTTGHIDFTTSASFDQVLAFYKQQCQSKRATIDTVRNGASSKALLVWDDGSLGRAVLVNASPSLAWMRTGTRFTLLTAALPLDFTPAQKWPPATGPVPDQLGLPVFPGAKADYYGQLRKGASQVAVARLRVVTSSEQLTGYYSGRNTGYSRSGSQTVQCTTFSRGCSVNILHPDPDLPAIVWLVKQ